MEWLVINNIVCPYQRSHLPLNPPKPPNPDRVQRRAIASTSISIKAIAKRVRLFLNQDSLS
ncbi:hypothetical protein [Allocoleopsis sp.]|uniref:hypothetical protein n=1 Tax=Allocoleopsis sp. TaxID=3088169 RepID=UPI002FD0198C